MAMIKYRPHRELLADSMAAVVEFPGRSEFIAYLANDMGPWGYALENDDVRVKAYGLDSRNGWNTHLLTLRNKEVRPGIWFFGAAMPDYFGAIGFTDGPC